MYGVPEDPGVFDEYYRNVHIPLLKRLPGVRQIYYGIASPNAGRDSDWHAMADAVFDDEEAMRAAFASAEWSAAIADVGPLNVNVSVFFGSMEFFS